MASPLPSDRTEYDGKLCVVHESKPVRAARPGPAPTHPPLVRLSARHKKKQAVNDKQLLLNRIALLKKEEQRAWKKIEKTRVRAEEIVRMRVENESQRLAREKAHRKAADAKRREAEENLALEERARAARAKLLDDLHEKKKQDVQKVHQERRLHRAEVSRQRQHEVAAKQDKVCGVAVPRPRRAAPALPDRAVPPAPPQPAPHPPSPPLPRRCKSSRATRGHCGNRSSGRWRSGLRRTGRGTRPRSTPRRRPGGDERRR